VGRRNLHVTLFLIHESSARSTEKITNVHEDRDNASPHFKVEAAFTESFQQDRRKADDAHN
jgi:hypothetical protein